jgi:hypothetical protein
VDKDALGAVLPLVPKLAVEIVDMVAVVVEMLV